MCTHFVIVIYVSFLTSSGTTGYVVLMPPQNYTVFENNASAVFYCSGDGYAVGWYLNGSAYNGVHVQMGIRVVPNPPTTVVSSTLYIPSNSINNNTKVFCKVIDTTFTNIQTSEPANLTIQGEYYSIKITLYMYAACVSFRYICTVFSAQFRFFFSFPLLHKNMKTKKYTLLASDEPLNVHNVSY